MALACSERGGQHGVPGRAHEPLRLIPESFSADEARAAPGHAPSAERESKGRARIPGGPVGTFQTHCLEAFPRPVRRAIVHVMTMKPEDRRSKRLVIYIEPWLFALLDHDASRAGLTLSAYVHGKLLRFVRRKKPRQ